MKPRFRILADGTDVTSNFDGVGVSITVTDAAGIESDRVEITVDDEHGQIAAPRTGAELAVWLGYEPALVFMGRYTVDEVRFEGWPQTVTIGGHAADQRDSLKERRTEAYEDKTLQDIFAEIAGRHGLIPAVAAAVGGFHYDYVAQQEESDEAFATRLGRLHGATATVKDGRLVVVPTGSGASASGASLGVFMVRRPGNLVSYAVTWKDKASHESVEASWFDRDEVDRETLEEEADDHGPAYGIRERFPDEAIAREAARAKAKEIRRGAGEATFEIEGDPAARAEMDLVCTGVRDRVDGPWSIERVEHRIDGAYTTTIHCKTPDGAERAGEAEASAEAASSSDALNWQAPEF